MFAAFCMFATLFYFYFIFYFFLTSPLQTAFLARDELCKSGSGHFPQNVALGEPRSWACGAADGTSPRTALLISAFGFPELMSINVDIMSLEQSK